VLGTTIETVELPRTSKIAARVEGRSTLARCGMTIHQTAPTIHAGFKGVITLEIRNEGPVPIKLRHEMRVCQLIFELLLSEPGRELASAFVGQRDASGGKRRVRKKRK
jgi:dCTP deaminase